jgi:hypothetical protein
LKNIHLLIVHEESPGIADHQIHPFVSFIHRNGDSFFYGIESIPEAGVQSSVLRENKNNCLFNIIGSYWQTPIIPTEGCISRRGNLMMGIEGICKDSKPDHNEEKHQHIGRQVASDDSKSTDGLLFLE